MAADRRRESSGRPSVRRCGSSIWPRLAVVWDVRSRGPARSGSDPSAIRPSWSTGQRAGPRSRPPTALPGHVAGSPKRYGRRWTEDLEACRYGYNVRAQTTHDASLSLAWRPKWGLRGRGWIDGSLCADATSVGSERGEQANLLRGWAAIARSGKQALAQRTSHGEPVPPRLMPSSKALQSSGRRPAATARVRAAGISKLSTAAHDPPTSSAAVSLLGPYLLV
ncbi:uncharacterized protein PSFLO_03255 [Pseudozyma flocculosa]|uniref:Uncharacterized protein n=1 Tax=Pseudozyma flocculosa TaxID=84751 RepID=A0A5C3F2U3_9BASI|nr:uncharacterized protein PSFLO_03255 [Pseudozyma flocculosa]